MTDSKTSNIGSFYLYSAVKDGGSKWHRSVKCAKREVTKNKQQSQEFIEKDFIEFMAMGHYESTSDITTETLCEKCADHLLPL